MLTVPFCGHNSQKWHMGYSIEGNFVNCWKCGSHRFIETVMEITRLPYNKVKKLLGDLETESFTRTETVKGKLVIPKDVMGKEFHPAHKIYLKGRGFDWGELKKLWSIMTISMSSSNLAWRIFIPIIHQSRFVSWTTRSISDRVPLRYISASEQEESEPHRNLLYGEDYARHAIIICEGVFDVWRIGAGAVAIFGSGYTQAQVLKMTRYPVRAVCFDNEPEAETRAKKLVNDLSVFPGETYSILLDSKDPGEATPKEIKQIRREILG